MAVKHPIKTFFQILFERQTRPLIYSSIPITNTRRDPARCKEIDRFRRDLAERVPIIDPLTIDELRSRDDELWSKLATPEGFANFNGLRWPINAPAVERPTPVHNPFAGLSTQQLQELRRTVEEQVVARDLLLVAQADGVAAYRPFYLEYDGQPLEKPSEGIFEEMMFAVGEKKRPVIAFHPKRDEHQRQAGFFRQYASGGQTLFFPGKQERDALASDDEATGYKPFLERVSAVRPFGLLS
jgi:hypothetical protein